MWISVGKLKDPVDNSFPLIYMLIGQYEHTIDNKKRLALPVKFRGELGCKVVVTRGVENCLVVYTEAEWQVMAQKLSNLPISQVEARSFARIILAGAMEVVVDKLGRILIPDYLKSYASLKKNVVVCGLSNRLEIWDSVKWENYKAKAEKGVEEIVSKLGPLGI
jgi:MraZ protein